MFKQNLQKLLPALLFIAGLSIWWIFYFLNMTTLNSQIDRKEKSIIKNCWVCYQDQSDLEKLYKQKTNIMSGFIKGE
jgi:hypothetical protein